MHGSPRVAIATRQSDSRQPDNRLRALFPLAVALAACLVPVREAFGAVIPPAKPLVVYIPIILVALSIPDLARRRYNVHRRVSSIQILACLAVCLPVLITSPFAIGEGSKVTATALIVLPAIVAIPHLVQSERDARLACYGLIWLSTCTLAVDVLIAGGPVFTIDGRLTILGLNPLMGARLAMLSACASIGLLITTRPRSARFAFLWTAAISSSIVLLLSASRGPILAAGAATLYVFILRRPTMPWPKRVFIVVCMSALMVVALRWVIPADSIDRLYNEGAASDGRGALYGLAYRVASERPLGVGIGGFARLGPTINPAGHDHPHNLLLEVVVEWGLPAATVLAAIAIRCVIVACRSTATSVVLFGPLLIGQLVAASFSSDLIGNSFLFTTIVIISRLAKCPTDGRGSLYAIHRHSSTEYVK